jgi:hypothetical protein
MHRISSFSYVVLFDIHDFCQYVVSTALALGLPLNISVAFEAQRIDLRLCLTFINTAPYVGNLRVSLAGAYTRSLSSST